MAYYRKKGASWFFTVRVTDANGLRRTIERFGGDTKKEAKQACLDFLATCETSASGRFAKICTMRYSDYLEEFYSVYVAPNLRENTQENYRRIIDRILKPQLGKYTLEKLTPLNIQVMVNGLAEKYSPSTVKLIINIIKKSMTEAVNFFNYIPDNPAISVRLPKNANEPKSVKQTKKCFSEDEIQRIFMKFPLPHIFFAPTRLAWHTGMRLGECLALKWDCVDMDEQVIYVKRNLLDRHGIEFGLPKTKGSRRIVPFGAALKQILLDIKGYQDNQRMIYPKDYKDEDNVCAKSDGSIITSDDMRYFGNWCHDNLGGGSFHTIRHSHASFLLAKGWTIEEVSKRLGHSNVQTTSAIYSHMNPERMCGQINRLDYVGL